MDKDEIRNYIDERLLERRQKRKVNNGHISYYNPMYMGDSWYND